MALSVDLKGFCNGFVAGCNGKRSLKTARLC